MWEGNRYYYRNRGLGSIIDVAVDAVMAVPRAFADGYWRGDRCGYGNDRYDRDRIGYERYERFDFDRDDWRRDYYREGCCDRCGCDYLECRCGFAWNWNLYDPDALKRQIDDRHPTLYALRWLKSMVGESGNPGLVGVVDAALRSLEGSGSRRPVTAEGVRGSVRTLAPQKKRKPKPRKKP